MNDNRWLVCPFCGWGKKFVTKKGRARLDRILPGEGGFIDFRDISGGRGSGFPRVTTITLKEAQEQPDYMDLIIQLRNQCNSILQVLSEEDDT